MGLAPASGIAMCHGGGCCSEPLKGFIHGAGIIIGLDLAKNIFQVHGMGTEGNIVCRRQLRRSQMLLFFSRLESCLVRMEACAGAYDWVRS